MGQPSIRHASFRLNRAIVKMTLPGLAFVLLFSFPNQISGQHSGTNEEIDSTSAVINQVTSTDYSAGAAWETVINTGEFNKGLILDAGGLIAGRLQGLRTRLVDGSPSAGYSFESLRNSTFNSSLAPLVLVDGVPVSAVPLLLNPYEIESIAWLQGGQAAEYGSFGSNGALLITTKKGKPGLHVTYSGRVALSSIKKYSVLSGDQVREALLDLYPDDPEIPGRAGNANTDWQGEIYSTAVSHDHHLAVSGSAANVPFRFSAGQTLAQGTIRSSYYRKTSFTGRIDPSILDDHLDISLSGSANLANQSSPGGVYLPYYAAIADPTSPVYVNNDPDQGYTTGSMFINPAAMLAYNDYLRKPEQFSVNLSADYRFHMLPGLRIGLKGAAIGYSDVTREVIFPGGGLPIINGYITTLNESLKARGLDVSTAYSRPIKSINGNLDIRAGYFIHWLGIETSELTTDYSDPDMIYEYTWSTSEISRRSVYGEVILSSMGKYYLNTVLRKDGFSEFSPVNRDVLSPSVTAEWNIAGESFFPSDIFINDLAISLTLGSAGTGSMISSITAVPSSGLKPATLTYLISGIRTGMFGNNVHLSVNAFINKNMDMLTETSLPSGSNFNGGDVNNKGIELRADASLVSGRRLTWKASLNLTARKNFVKNLPDGIDFISAGFVPLIPYAEVLIQSKGRPVNTFYLLRQVYDENGLPIQGLYEDTDNSGSTGFEDRYYGFSTDPEFTAGIWSSLRYGNWEFSFSATSLSGNWCYNLESAYGNYGNMTPGNTLRNISSLVYESGFTAMVPYSDYHIDNGSFLRLDFISLEHTFRNVADKSIDIILGATLQNAFMLTGYRGSDPDNEGGITGYTWPKPRTASLSLNIGF